MSATPDLTVTLKCSSLILDLANLARMAASIAASLDAAGLDGAAPKAIRELVRTTRRARIMSFE